jgi:hypothetical protein
VERMSVCCPKCGFDLPWGRKICHGCGLNVSEFTRRPAHELEAEQATSATRAGVRASPNGSGPASPVSSPLLAKRKGHTRVASGGVKVAEAADPAAKRKGHLRSPSGKDLNKSVDTVLQVTLSEEASNKGKGKDEKKPFFALNVDKAASASAEGQKDKDPTSPRKGLKLGSPFGRRAPDEKKEQPAAAPPRTPASPSVSKVAVASAPPSQSPSKPPPTASPVAQRPPPPSATQTTTPQQSPTPAALQPAALAAQAKQLRSSVTRPINPCDPIINELIKTEETYLHDLGLVCRHFLGPCREKGIVSGEDLVLVFSNVEALLRLHETVVVGLRNEAFKPMAQQNWGMTFRSYEGNFRTEYQVYTKNQAKARARRAHLEKVDPVFKVSGWRCERRFQLTVCAPKTGLPCRDVQAPLCGAAAARPQLVPHQTCSAHL